MLASGNSMNEECWVYTFVVNFNSHFSVFNLKSLFSPACSYYPQCADKCLKIGSLNKQTEKKKNEEVCAYMHNECVYYTFY